MLLYLFPAQEKDFIQKTKESKVSLLCSLQVGLFSLVHYNSINLPIMLTYVVYLSLKDSDKMEKKENCMNIRMSLYCWISAVFGRSIMFFFSYKKTEEDLVCWVAKDLTIIVHLGMTFLYLMIILIILYKIKLNLLMMIKKEEMSEVEGSKYLKSFNKFFLFFCWLQRLAVMYICISQIIIEKLG